MTITLDTLKTEFYFALAENKIELIDGRLIVNSDLKNSLTTLQLILAGWGADAAVALAPIPLWWEALRMAYADLLPPALREPHSEKYAEQWQEWSQRYSHWQAAYPIRGKQYNSHNEVRWKLIMEFHEKTSHLGDCYGRVLAMKIGEDVFTPDVYFLSNEHLARQYSYYLDGPADIVMEILINDFEAADRIIKFCKYEKAGVPEYWILDPAKKAFEAYQLQNGSYSLVFSGVGSYYSTPRLPGVRLEIANLWDDSYESPPCLLIEGDIPKPIKRPSHTNDIYWGSIPFAPRIALDATKISFEEFIAWAPESKFELHEGRLVIGCDTGTKNVLGMALMTFGLLETIPLLPAKMWVESLLRLSDPSRDQKRKADVLELARKAARILREKHQVRRVAVTGDLLKEAPWNSFSEVELVVWDDLGDSYKAWENIRDIFGETLFSVHEPKYTSFEEYSRIEQQPLDI